METVYIETSVISYLRQQTPQHVVSAARQLQTKRWWDEERDKYLLVTSEYTIEEASAGDATLAAERLAHLAPLPILQTEDDVRQLADALVDVAGLPMKARVDAFHIAICVVHEVSYLMTWNCTHIANAKIIKDVSAFLTERGLGMPVICTPDSLLDN